MTSDILHKPSSIEDSLVIGIDLSPGTSESAISILRLKNGKYTLLNNIYGREAEELYEYLIGRSPTL